MATKEKLSKVVDYLHKCLKDMPDDVLPDIQEKWDNGSEYEEDIEILLTGVANVLCNLAWAAGATRETFLDNVVDIWDQKEAAEIKAEAESGRVLN